MKLSGKILAASLIPFLIIILLYSFLSARTFSTYLEDLFLEQSETKILQAEADIRNFILNNEYQLKLLALLNPPTRKDPALARITLQALMHYIEAFFRLAVISANGQIWLQTYKFPETDLHTDPGSLLESPIFTLPIERHLPFLGDIHFEKNFSSPFVSLSIPLKNEASGKVENVLWAHLSFQGIPAILERYIPPDGKIMLIDTKKGQILAEADNSSGDASALHDEFIREIAAAPTQQAITMKHDTTGDATYLFKNFQIHGLPLTLLYYQPTHKILYLSDKLKAYNLYLLCTGIFLFTLSSFLLIRQIIAPLSKITASIIDLGNKFQTSAQNRLLKQPPGDEVDHLHHAFALFQEQLILYRSEIESVYQNLEMVVHQRTNDLTLAKKQLVHAEKLSAIGKLSASIAHEFNNPLYGIQSIIEGLKLTNTMDDEDRELADLALSECRRVKKLIKDLQDFNKPSSGIKKSVNILTLLDDMLLICAKELKDAKISVKKIYAELPEITVVDDQIKQVFLNIISNSCDAMREHGGTLLLEAEALTKTIAIHFSDTGTGIKPADLEHIFEPFFTTKSAVKGTGLGLSVSYGIIKSHGGEITVASEPGKGTRFSIFLPR